MRNSTKEKLFGDAYHRTIAEFTDAEYDVTFTIVQVHGDDDTYKTVIVQEWSNEADGFDVYLRTPGNKVSAAREFIGLSND